MEAKSMKVPRTGDNGEKDGDGDHHVERAILFHS